MIFLKDKPKVTGPLVVWPGGVNESPVVEEFRQDRQSLMRRFMRQTFNPLRWKRPRENQAYTIRGSEALATQQSAGTLFNTFTTAKSVINPQALYNIPAGDQFWFIGKTLRITIAGGLSNIVTTPGTVTFQIMLGSIVVFTTGAIQLNATAHTTLPFWMEAILTVQSLGSGTAAKFMGMSWVQGIMFTLTAAQVDAVNTGGVYSAPATAPAQGTGFDSTVANVLDFWTGFSINNSGNGVQVALYLVEALN